MRQRRPWALLPGAQTTTAMAVQSPCDPVARLGEPWHPPFQSPRLMLRWGLLGWLGGALCYWWAGEMPPCLSLRQEGGRVPGREVLPGNNQAVRTRFGFPCTQSTLPLSSPHLLRETPKGGGVGSQGSNEGGLLLHVNSKALEPALRCRQTHSLPHASYIAQQDRAWFPPLPGKGAQLILEYSPRRGAHSFLEAPSASEFSSPQHPRKLLKGKSVHITP